MFFYFQCDPGVGVDRFFHALYTQTSTRMVMLLGSACSEVTESLAKVVPYWNIVQVSNYNFLTHFYYYIKCFKHTEIITRFSRYS